MIFRIPRLIEHISSIMTLEVRQDNRVHSPDLFTQLHRRVTSSSPELLLVLALLIQVTVLNALLLTQLGKYLPS
jgi:hypothetical protein